MRILLLCAALLALALACAPLTPAPAEKTYFSLADADRLIPGSSTRADVQRLLGKPFTEITDAQGRPQWVYMHTIRRQLLLSFSGETLAGKEWSEKYGSPVGLPL